MTSVTPPVLTPNEHKVRRCSKSRTFNRNMKNDLSSLLCLSICSADVLCWLYVTPEHSVDAGFYSGEIFSK